LSANTVCGPDVTRHFLHSDCRADRIRNALLAVSVSCLPMSSRLLAALAFFDLGCGVDGIDRDRRFRIALAIASAFECSTDDH